MMTTIDCIVVGAGISGLVLAERIASQLDRRVLVIEKRHHVGGNCYDERDDNNILVHRYGPHIFHTNNKDVVHYLSRFTEWNIYNHKVLSYIDGKAVPVPFNLDTIQKLFPPEMAGKLQKSMVERYGYNTRVPILDLLKTEDGDLRFLAEYVYEKVFLGYTAKQWGMKPDQMDKFVTARVPVFVGRDDRYFNDKYQQIPKRGYTALFLRMLKHRNIKLMLNTDFREIVCLKGNEFYLYGSKFEGEVIYSGEIDELFSYKYGKLPYRSVRMEFETIRREKYQEVATVNYPNQYEFTRITEFKHIHPVVTGCTTILKEYPQGYVAGKNIPYYPVFTRESRETYEKYRKEAETVPRLTLIGRLAEYRYYDMDDAVENALHVFERKFG